MSFTSDKARDAALQLTLATLAKIDLTSATKGPGTAAAKGEIAAEFVNGVYNGILASLEKKQ